MMRVHISRSTYTYGDNMSVIHNIQRQESTLKKNLNSIAYHACLESVAMNEMRTNEDISDLATKVHAQERPFSL